MFCFASCDCDSYHFAIELPSLVDFPRVETLFVVRFMVERVFGVKSCTARSNANLTRIACVSTLARRRCLIWQNSCHYVRICKSFAKLFTFTRISWRIPRSRGAPQPAASKTGGASGDKSSVALWPIKLLLTLNSIEIPFWQRFRRY